MSAPQLTRERSGSLEKKRSSSDDVEAKVRVNAHDVFDEEEAGIDPVYQAKARLLNEALQDIGMGRYQVRPVSSRTVKTSFKLS